MIYLASKEETETNHSVNHRITGWFGLKGPKDHPVPTSHLDQAAPSPIQAGPERPTCDLELNQEVLPWGVSSKEPSIPFLPRGGGKKFPEMSTLPAANAHNLCVLCCFSPLTVDGRGKQHRPQHCTPSW